MPTNVKVGIVVGAVAVTLLVVVAVTAASSDSAAVSASAATFSALAAVVTASISAATLTQLQRDSRATTRPQVGAWMRRGGAAGTIDLIVRNFGGSIAHAVRVDIVGLPEWAASDRVLEGLWRRYQGVIDTLVPGLELGNTYMHPDWAPVTPPPAQIAVRVSYTDDEGRPFSDTFELDAETIRAETWSLQE